MSNLMRFDAIFDKFEKSRSYQFLAIAITTIFGLALRFYKLGEWSFWGDEMITVNRARGIFEGGIQFSSVSLVLTNLSLQLFGTSEWSARVIPALIGVVSIPVLFVLVRNILDATTAFFSTLLLAVSTWHLYWSQNARFYTSLLLFYTIAMLAFFIGMEKNRPWLLVVSMLSFGLALQERMVAAILVFVIVGYVLLIKILRYEAPPGFNLRNFAMFLVPGILIGAYMAIPYLQQPSLFSELFSWIDDRVNNNALWILSGAVYYIGIPTLVIGLFGGLYLINNKNRTSLFLLLGGVLPVLIIIALSPIVYTANRYIFISLTSWVMLGGIALRELTLQAPAKLRILVIGVIMILVLQPLSENVLYYRFQNGNRDNWKAAFEVIKQQRQAGDMVVSADRMLANYYLQDDTVGMANLTPKDLESNGHRIWFVEDMNVQQKWPWIHRWLVENTKLVANFDVSVRARTYIIRVYQTQ